MQRKALHTLFLTWLFLGPAIAEEMTFRSEDGRIDVTIPQDCECKFEIAFSDFDIELFFHEFDGPDFGGLNSSAVLFFSQYIDDDISDEELSYLSISILQDFVSKFNIRNLSQGYLGIGFIYSNGSTPSGFVAIPKRIVLQLSNRDWGVEDLGDPTGKLPFREAVKHMVYLKFSDFVVDNKKTQSFQRVANDFEDYSLFDLFVEEAYYSDENGDDGQSISWEVVGSFPLSKESGDLVDGFSYTISCESGELSSVTYNSDLEPKGFLGYNFDMFSTLEQAAESICQ